MKKAKKKRVPIMMTPVSVYTLFMKKKGQYMAKTGKSISNHKFLKFLLEKVKI